MASIIDVKGTAIVLDHVLTVSHVEHVKWGIETEPDSYTVSMRMAFSEKLLTFYFDNEQQATVARDRIISALSAVGPIFKVL